MTRVLVCGGRTFDDRGAMAATLLRFVLGGKTATLIHGGAAGADSLAREFFEDFEMPCEAYPADWKKHGRAAGPIRNQRMLEEGKPDIVIAFPGGPGTADMVRRARAAGVEVREVFPAREGGTHHG